MVETRSLLEGLQADLQANRLALPPMPEVAVKVGHYLNEDQGHARDLAKLLAADAVLAGRLVQIANSAFFMGLAPVETVQAAVTRLGGVCVRNLVNSLVVGQMFDRPAAAIRAPMRQAWLHSTRVAAHSYAIARRFTKLSPDEALLAGLLHNIGAVPILTHLAREGAMDAAAVQEAVDLLHTQVGPLLLRHWGLQESFVQVAEEHGDLLRERVGDADLVDVVLVANLHCRVGSDHPLGRVPWDGVPAFGRLGLTPEGSLAAMRDARAEVEALQSLLQG